MILRKIKVLGLALVLLAGFAAPPAVYAADLPDTLSLDEAISRALTYSKTIQAAEMTKEKNEYADIDGQRTFDRVLTTYGWDGQGLYEQALVGLLKGSYDYRSSEKNLETARESVRLSVTDAYWKILLGQDALSLSEQNLVLQRRELSKNQLYYQLGMLDATSLQALKLRYDQAAADLSKKTSDLDIAYRALAEMIQRPLDYRPVLTDSLVRQSLTITSLDYHITSLEEASPDLWQMQQLIKLSEATANLAYFQGGSDPYRSGQIGVDLSKLQATEAKKAFREAIRTMYASLQTLEDALNLTADSLKVTGERYAQTQLRCDLGLASPLELLEAQYAYNEAHNQLENMIYNYNLALMAFERPWAAR
jgi:outer membrane protein TolC